MRRRAAAAARAGRDIWFEAVTATDRFITPVNGAVIARIALPKPAINDCVTTLRQGSVERWPVASEPGIPFCYRTAAGGMGYFSVVAPVGPSPGVLIINVQSF